MTMPTSTPTAATKAAPSKKRTLAIVGAAAAVVVLALFMKSKAPAGATTTTAGTAVTGTSPGVNYANMLPYLGGGDTGSPSSVSASSSTSSVTPTGSPAPAPTPPATRTVTVVQGSNPTGPKTPATVTGSGTSTVVRAPTGAVTAPNSIAAGGEPTGPVGTETAGGDWITGYNQYGAIETDYDPSTGQVTAISHGATSPERPGETFTPTNDKWVANSGAVAREQGSAARTTTMTGLVHSPAPTLPVGAGRSGRATGKAVRA